MIEFATLASIVSIATGVPSAMEHIIGAYSYLGIFFLMLLESASLPIPSEIVLPVIGALSAASKLDVYLGIIAAIAGSMVGIAVDYYAAYYIGKDIVYRHLGAFHIKRKTLDGFDEWFKENGRFAVFISRLLPVVRGLISFPAGFAMMPKRQFFFYSFMGTVIWDVVLVLFGYYALSTSNVYLLMGTIAAFGIALYVIYAVAIRRINVMAKHKHA